MKSLEQFGKQLVGYEGVANVRFQDSQMEMDCSGYFEAVQFPSGRLTIAVVPTGLLRPTNATLHKDPKSSISFEGNTLDGWTITCSGSPFFSRLSWLLAPMANQPKELGFYPQYITAAHTKASEDGYRKAQFLVCNLVWFNNPHQSEAEPIELRVLGYDITITPVNNYFDIAPPLANTHGIEPTAWVTMETPGSERKSLDSFKDLMDDLLYVLRLATGNLVSWYYGEAVGDTTERTVERIHQYAVSSLFSSTIDFRPLNSRSQSAIPKLDLQALTQAFFSDSGQALEMATLKPLINQFTNTCDQTSYLESRGLLASTLTELLASKLAYQKGNTEFIPQKEYEAEKLPTLKAAIDETDWSPRIKGHLRNHLRGAYRTTFRQKLKDLNDSLALGLNSTDDIGRIVNVRNSLVHEGTYRPTFKEDGGLEDYRFLTWANFSFLCKLLGYTGELPQFYEGRHLEV